MLTKVIAIYDPIKKQMNSAMSSMSVCKINEISCKVGSRLFIWTPPPKIDCPQTDDVGTHDLWLHYLVKILYRIEVSYLHVSVHPQITCPAKTIQCYGTKTICEPSGLLLIPSNCTEIKALAHHNVLSSFMKNYTGHHSQQTIVSRFVTETSDITAEKLRNLTRRHPLRGMPAAVPFHDLIFCYGKAVSGIDPIFTHWPEKSCNHGR